MHMSRMDICVCIYVLCMHVGMYAMHVYVYIYIYIYIYISVCVCIYIYIYISRIRCVSVYAVEICSLSCALRTWAMYTHEKDQNIQTHKNTYPCTQIHTFPYFSLSSERNTFCNCCSVASNTRTHTRTHKRTRKHKYINKNIHSYIYM